MDNYDDDVFGREWWEDRNTTIRDKVKNYEWFMPQNQKQSSFEFRAFKTDEKFKCCKMNVVFP